MNKNIIKFLLKSMIISAIFMGSSALAQSGRRLSGDVTDSKTGDSLIGCNIIIEGTVLGAATNMNGEFSITGIKPGSYKISASMMGYTKKTVESVIITESENTILRIALEPSILEMPSVIVTASKRRQEIEDAAVSLDVIAEDALRLRSMISLDEAIKNIAGVGIIDGQIDIRGSTGFNWAAGSRVLLMIDGHPMISGDTGGINWDAVPVEEVESIEVVKGAGSALYGSNAMAGMINILTRDPSDVPETRFKLSWGFFDEPAYSEWKWTDRFLRTQIADGSLDLSKTLSTRAVNISHSRSTGKLGLLFSFGSKNSTQYYQNGEYERYNALFKGKYDFSDNKRLTVTGNWALADHEKLIQWRSQNQPLLAPEAEIGNTLRHEKIHIQASFRHAQGNHFAYTIKSSAYRNDWLNRFHDNQDYAVNDRLNMEVQCDFLLGGHPFTFGTEATYHQTKSLIYGNQSTWTLSGYAENERQITDWWTVSLGARFDHHRIAGISADQQLSPRLGMVFKPGKNAVFRLSAGHGFRAPSIAEVFANIMVSGFPVIPNLDLKEAERAWNFEAGWRQPLILPHHFSSSSDNIFNHFLQWLAPALAFDLAVFWTRYTNMIDVHLNEREMAFQFINLLDAKNQGFEIRLMGNFFEKLISWNAGFTYIDPVDLTTKKTLNYRSKNRLNAGFTLTKGRLSIGYDYRYASRIEEVVEIYANDQRVPVHVMDGRIVYDLGKIQLSIEGKNLGNYHYALRQRFLEPVRSFTFTVKGNI